MFNLEVPAPTHRWLRGLVIVLAMALAAILLGKIHDAFEDLDDDEADIYYMWKEGDHLFHGINPYSRIREGNMLENEKYPTLLPGFYLLSALTEYGTGTEFDDWLKRWHVSFFIAHLLLGGIVLWRLSRRSLVLALFAFLFVLFNRWGVKVLWSARLDPIPLFFFVAATLLLPRRPVAACLLLSVSLVIKQVAVFAIPIFLIVVWYQAPPEHRKRQALLSLLAIGALPVLVSIPFLVLDAEGFVKSILFSATREADMEWWLPTVFENRALQSALNRLPILLLLAAVCWSTARRFIGPITALLLAMTCFVCFNSVFFPQYAYWLMPLIPLALWEQFESHRTEAPPASP